MIRAGFVLFFLGLYLSVASQSDAFRNYRMKDGLTGNTIYSIYQDKKGFLWICTESGVSMFDGVRFRNFTTDDGLTENEIFQVYEDRSGRIWFIGYNGIPSYYFKGEILNYRNIPVLRKVRPEGLGMKMTEDQEGNLWYLTTSTLYRYSAKGDLDTLVHPDYPDSRFLDI